MLKNVHTQSSLCNFAAEFKNDWFINKRNARMKKLMMMVVAAMMATVNVNAQVENLRHEIGVTYGTGVSVFGDGLGEGLGRAIANGMFGMGKVGTETYDEKDFGTLSLEYFYHLNNPRLAVGGILGYATTSQKYRDMSTKNPEGDRTRNYYTVMPSIKYYWVNKNYFGLYSKAAIGATFVNAKVNKNGSKDTENKTYFSYQASFIGVEGGIPNLRAFVEGGFGEQGVIALGGVRVKF